MRILNPRPDFVIVEDYFNPKQAAQWLDWIFKKGGESLRGFHHPDLKPNRFHKHPKYPVKKYMCLGLYWDPMTYAYSTVMSESGTKPFPIPKKLADLCRDILDSHYPWDHYSAETTLINYYTTDSRMGLHVDKDEENHLAPVIGLNFGSACRFFFEDQKGEIRDVKIHGNSIYIFGKSARLMRHGLGSIYSNSLSAGSEGYLSNKERVNLTIRQVYQ